MKKATIITLCLALLTLAATPIADAASADKPRIAVLEFENKADNQWHWWYDRGASAIQDVMVTELVKSGKFRVIDRERLAALMAEQNLSLSGAIDPATAVKAGKLLGVEYFLVGAVTEYGKTDSNVRTPGFRKIPGFSGGKSKFVAAANARIIDAETGEIIWADEARDEASTGNLYISGGGGGGVDDERAFDKVLKPICQQLAASIKNADL